MQLQPEAETTQPTSAIVRSFAEWLEDLAAGKCDWETMFRGVLAAVNANPDSGWELLALVDQHYRLHRIKEADFLGLNSSLKAVLLGTPASGRSAPVAKSPAIEASAGAARQTAASSMTARVARSSRKPATATPAAVSMPRAQPAAPESEHESKIEHSPERLRENIAETGQSRRPRMLVVDEILRNRYRIGGILGHGGMGTVYAAIDEFRLDQADGGQRVAIKVLHTRIIERPKLLAELRSEFQRLQSLSHPNIVRVHEFDRDDDLTFFTMEQLTGAALGRLINHDSIPLYRPYALTIIRQIGAAVAYAHSRGIVHGDLNPGNVFITDQGEIRVLDFGASYRLYREPTIPDVEELSRTAVATPSYASCEVLQGGPANVRDDIYALACISYVLLSGKHPFQGRNALQARAARLSPRRPAGLDNRKWRALRAGLRFDREQRPADMEAWLEQLSLESETRPLPSLATITTARPPRRSSAGWVTAVLIALAAALGWWALENPHVVSRSAADLKSTTAAAWRGMHRDAADEQAATTAAAAQPAAEIPPPAAEASTIAPKAMPTQPTPAVSPDSPHATPGNASPTDGAAITAAGSASGTPRARLEMAADEVDVAPLSAVATVIVRRHESARDNVSFTWWTESGTAKPGRDFVPVDPRTEYLTSGDREAQLLVPVVADPRRHDSRSFYVVIDHPSDGAKLGSRTLTMVTIPPSE